MILKCDRGRSMKIATLLPSATEIVCRLGFESNLVGVSHECDYPPGVERLPRLTRTRIDSHAPSSEIHASVEQWVREALGVYELDLDLLRALEPDCIITQSLCDVCAVPLNQVVQACREVLHREVTLVNLTPACLDDVWRDVERVAAALKAPEAGREFRREVECRVNAIRERLDHGSGPSVLAIEWIDPVYIGGLWMPDLIRICGGRALLAESGQRAPVVSCEQLEAIDPDVVLVKPCGFKLDQLVPEMDTLKRALPWRNWKATRDQRWYIADGNAFFNRPGPRLLDSLELLAYCMAPETFPEFGPRYRESFVRLRAGLALP